MRVTYQLHSLLWSFVIACTAACADKGSTTNPVATPGGSIPVVSGGTGATIANPPPLATAGTTGVALGTAGRPAIVGQAGSPAIIPPPAPIAGTGAVAGVAGRGPVSIPGAAGAPAAAGGPAPAPMMYPLTPPLDNTCLKPGSGSYGEPGPYKVATKVVDLGMIEATQHTGKFTIYYPEPLETNCLHPIVAWGNGTTVMGSGTYAFLTNNAASWGMVVAESQEDNTGSGNFHKAGIDYLLKENADPMSPFYKKLSTRAGTSGHSQGGFGASIGSSHPNAVTSVVEGASFVASQKVSVLVLTGTMDIVMGAENLVTNAKGPMFVAVWEGGDHVTTETIAGYITRDKGTMQFQRLYAAWFRCFLGDDKNACKLFQGGTPSACGMCKDTGWHVLASKNL